jgi:Cellulase N-terminal ig-like domain
MKFPWIFTVCPSLGFISSLSLSLVSSAIAADTKIAPGDPVLSPQPIALNQVGYETGSPKRFTVPKAADGTRFSIRLAAGGEPLFSGEIRGNIGDFSALKPADSTDHYVVECDGATKAKSDPFLIRSNLNREQFWQPAVDFLIDARSAVGSHPSAFGGSPWRDGCYYDAIVPSLVMLYLADPAGVNSMLKQIDWAADKKRVTAPQFAFDEKIGDKSAKGYMGFVKAYYELEPPAADAPDVVKLIHWGSGMYLVKPTTQDIMGDPLGARIHPQTMEQLVYVLWAWPSLKQWLPQSFYDKISALVLANWSPSLEISRWWEAKTYITPESLTEKNPMGGLLHPFKGRHAPGHSIVPNLLMHEVSKRDGRKDAAIYLDAAVKQADWCVKNLDWNDPRTTKGHRMSEHRTIPNLVWLLQKYPDKAPAGLKAKINAWVDVAISRSENMWDYRRYDMANHWSIPKLNDVGNLLAFPAIAKAASWVVDDAKKKARLEQLSVAAIDHVFGRNPRMAAAPDDEEMGFPEVERGWPVSHPPGCAFLGTCRGSISSAPGSEMFPFKPEGAYRHREGWVNYGASWCMSLAYLRFDSDKKITPNF